MDFNNGSDFEKIKHINEYGQEFWYARELQKALDYSEWRNFLNALNKAYISCEVSGFSTSDHFVEVNKMVPLGSGAERKQVDYQLSRYACYLIVQNGDPKKEVIALGQTYFAVKTREQELAGGYLCLCCLVPRSHRLVLRTRNARPYKISGSVLIKLNKRIAF